MTNEYSSSIRYIGVDDLDIDLFESQYVVPEGMSYNSWVILDEKIAIMDTADGRKEKEWTSNLVAALDGRTPDYLVCQHMEPDHSAIIGKTMQEYPTLTLVCSQQTVKNMNTLCATMLQPQTAFSTMHTTSRYLFDNKS